MEQDRELSYQPEEYAHKEDEERVTLPHWYWAEQAETRIVSSFTVVSA